MTDNQPLHAQRGCIRCADGGDHTDTTTSLIGATLCSLEKIARTTISECNWARRVFLNDHIEEMFCAMRAYMQCDEPQSYEQAIHAILICTYDAIVFLGAPTGSMINICAKMASCVLDSYCERNGSQCSTSMNYDTQCAKVARKIAIALCSGSLQEYDDHDARSSVVTQREIWNILCKIGTTGAQSQVLRAEIFANIVRELLERDGTFFADLSNTARDRIYAALARRANFPEDSAVADIMLAESIVSAIRCDLLKLRCAIPRSGEIARYSCMLRFARSQLHCLPHLVGIEHDPQICNFDELDA